MGVSFSTKERELLSELRVSLASAEGLGLPALLCLLEIAVNEGLSVSELAERTHSPQQSVSRYVSMLLGRYQTDPTTLPFEPLIEQRINLADPRKRSLHLTDAGARQVSRLIRPVAFGRE